MLKKDIFVKLLKAIGFRDEAHYGRFIFSCSVITNLLTEQERVMLRFFEGNRLLYPNKDIDVCDIYAYFFIPFGINKESVDSTLYLLKDKGLIVDLKNGDDVSYSLSFLEGHAVARMVVNEGIIC